MEVERNIKPDMRFLKCIEKMCKKKKIVLIFDECTSGFREVYGGIYKKYNLKPDIVMYGKSLGNGFPISAIVGKNKVMNMSKKTFISSTFWTENIGIIAAIQTLKMMRKKKSWLIIKKKGQFIKKEIKKISDKYNLEVKVTGIDAMPKIQFNKKFNELYCNFICYEMLKKGYLFKNTVYLSISHTESIIKNFLKILDNIFYKIKNNKIKNLYSKSDFKRYN